MKCPHCCNSCTKKGEDMSLETFRKALQMNDGYITIGGGEPTLHPDFLTILIESIADPNTEETGVHVITNGKISRHALTLASLAKKGVIGAELSRDDYHDEIEWKVVEAFTKDKKPHSYGSMDNGHDFRGIRTVQRILARGRGKKIKGALDECACDDLLIDPKGVVWSCGCKAVSFGTVDDYTIPDDYQRGEDCGSKSKKEGGDEE
jgi:hypothetical protein